MKTFIVILLGLAASLSACNNTELDQANQQKDSLRVVINNQDSTLNDFIASFNDIESRLDSVTAKQRIIYRNTLNNNEYTTPTKDRINLEIDAINKLMEENNKTIKGLINKFKNSSRKNTQLEKTIVTLNNQLKQKFIELDLLNDQLAKSNAEIAQLKTSIDTLTLQNDQKSQTIAEETNALHTAYYIVGKSKDLEEEKLIDKKGGLLGIGKTSKLSENFDNSKFIRIDYTKLDSISINSKDVKLITTHPANSYALNKNVKGKSITTNLVIKDPEKFWSITKYLVVVKS